jgi:hypothetical protein
MRSWSRAAAILGAIMLALSIAAILYNLGVALTKDREAQRAALLLPFWLYLFEMFALGLVLVALAGIENAIREQTAALRERWHDEDHRR